MTCLNLFLTYDINKLKGRDMNHNKFRTNEDIRLIREMARLSQAELGKKTGVTTVTISRWENGETSITDDNLERMYSFAYNEGIHLNEIKEQFYREELYPYEKLLFHGAKKTLEGPIRVDVARENNDFGSGFYMGETFRQAALFISNFANSCVYALSFDPKGLKRAEYQVDSEWLMTIAAFRGRLRGRASEEYLDKIYRKVNDADYIVAPIADNRMYNIINAFIDGEITDEQCRHSLAATNLGMQFVAHSERAAERIKVLERCYLCDKEKKTYVTNRAEDLSAADNKVRAARIKYRGIGKYIDELL